MNRLINNIIIVITITMAAVFFFAMPVSAAAHDEMPLYDQNDYPDTLFGHGTIASSGCSITSMAMVASYYTGQEITPEAIALAKGQPGMTYESYMGIIEDVAEEIELPYEGKIFGIDEMKSELEAGAVIIALVNEESIFTDYGHFIVLTGISDDDRFMVKDPNGCNYKRLDFSEGFQWHEIAKGLSGGLLFSARDENATYNQDAIDSIIGCVN